MRYTMNHALFVGIASAVFASATMAQQQVYPSRPPAPAPSTPSTPSTAISPTYDDCGTQGAQTGSSTASAPITGAGTNGQYGLKAPTNPSSNNLRPRTYAATPASSAPSSYSNPGAGGYGATPSARVYQAQAATQPQLGQASPSLGVPQSHSGQSGYAVAHTNCGQARSSTVR